MAKGKFERLSLVEKTVTFIVDDQDADVEYLCEVLKQNVSASFFQNTWTTTTDSDCGAAWFQYKFNGTGVHISNRLPSSQFAPQSGFAVQVDGSPLLRHTGSGIYDTPILIDGEHTVVYAVSNVNASLAPAFDYLTVTAGPSTNLLGKSIILDDTDDSLEYTGDWAVIPPDALVLDSSSAPYKNTTHWARSVGDSVKLKFAGTSISVYRTIPRPPLDNDALGNITFSYTLDNDNSGSISMPMTSTEPRAVPMAQFLQLNSLSSTEIHTLELNITDIPSGAASPGLGLDFFTYTAAFTDLASMPDSSSSVSGSGSKLNVGAVVGGVIGGVVGSLLLVGLLAFLWRRRAHNRKIEQQQVLPVPVGMPSGSRKSSFDSWAEGKETKHESLTPAILRRDD